MAVFLLIRHAHHSDIGKRILGWMPGVHISGEGRVQAERLAEVPAGRRIDAILSSPLERTLATTAAPLGRRLGLPVEVSAVFGEVRAGEWTGQDFADLERDPRWQTYNLFCSGVRPAGGELAAEVQARSVAEMERLRAERPDAVMAVFSHADPIGAAVAYYAGIPLGLLLRIHIEPASLNTIEINDWGPLLREVNIPLPDGTPSAT